MSRLQKTIVNIIRASENDYKLPETYSVKQKKHREIFPYNDEKLLMNSNVVKLAAPQSYCFQWR